MGGGGKSGKATTPDYNSIQVQTSSYALPIPLVFGVAKSGSNIVWNGHFLAQPVAASGGGGGKGGGGSGGGGKGGGASSYNYIIDGIMALCEGPIYGVRMVWDGQTVTTAAAEGFTVIDGSIGQAVWSYLTGNYPNQAVPYSGVAFIGTTDYNLGSSAALPNINFEILGIGSDVTLNYPTNVPASGPYTIQVPKAVITMKVGTTGQPTLTAVNYWIADHGVNYANGTPLTKVGSSPSSGQYSVVDSTTSSAAGTYTFNSADAAAGITISYECYTDADPSVVVTQLLTNAQFGVGFPTNRLGTILNLSESHTIPSSGPYTVTVADAALYGWNLDVVDGSGNIYTCVGSSPGAGQYSYAAGVYTFNSTNASTSITINYAAVSPNLTSFQAFTLAQDLRISPTYDSATAANSMLQDIGDGCYSEFVWSSGVITLVPRGSSAVSGWGYTYTPNNTPLVVLNDDYLMTNSNGGGASSSDDPVEVTRIRTADQINDIQLEIVDRINQYATAEVEIVDQALIDKFSRRTNGSKSLHMFADIQAGNTSAQLQLQKEYIRNTYSFQLESQFCWLDPMDIVELVDAYVFSDLPNNAQLVRITEITENDDGTLTFAAEEYPIGTGNAVSYNLNPAQGFAPNFNNDPGAVNQPIIFTAPLNLTNGNLEVWCALSGVSPLSWGGVNVWLSYDNETYSLVDTQTGATRMGVTTAIFGSGSDPDTTDTLAVDLTESQGQLTGGTQLDADQAATLCVVANVNASTVDGVTTLENDNLEFVSYQQATLTAQYKYSLGAYGGMAGYLRRGLFNSTIGSHSSGSNFARVDNYIFRVPVTKGVIGETIYLKFQPFNIYNGGTESLSSSSIVTYAFEIPTPPPPPTVMGLLAQQNGNVVVFQWDPVEDPFLYQYIIGYAEVGTTDWTDFTLITEAAAGTEMTNGDVPPGTWVFGIVAQDVTGQVSTTVDTYDLTVTDANGALEDVFQGAELGWNGTLSGFVNHYTGVLVPDDQYLASHYSTTAALFNFMVPTPVTSSVYESQPIDIGYNTEIRAYANITTALGPDDTGAAASTTSAIDTWSTGESDPVDWISWTIGYVNCRYLRWQLTYDASAGNVSFIKELEVVEDGSTVTEQANSVVISGGGTTVTFPQPFHAAPYVVATVVGSTALYATVASITATTCVIHVWNSSGSDVGGTVNYTATGN